MIEPILYERIEQKKEIERAMFSKLSPEQKDVLAKDWMAFLSLVSQSGDDSRVPSELPPEGLDKLEFK